MCVSMYVMPVYGCSACENMYPWKPEGIRPHGSLLVWLLVINLRSSGRAVYTLQCRAIFLALPYTNSIELEFLMWSSLMHV